MEWQPIESAPTDGRMVIVASYHEADEEYPAGWALDLVVASEDDFESISGSAVSRRLGYAMYSLWCAIPSIPDTPTGAA